MKTKCYHQFPLFILLLLVPLVCSGQAERMAPVSAHLDMDTEVWQAGDYLYFTFFTRPSQESYNLLVKELWQTHLPSGQTRRMEIPGNAYPQFGALKGQKFFVFAAAGGNLPATLYRIEDGQIVSSVPISHVNKLVDGPDGDEQMYFVVNPGSDNYSLWRSDGSAQGTVQLVGGLSGNLLTAVLGHRIFLCDNSNRLIFNDGTPGHTQLLRVLPRNITHFHRVGNVLVFGVSQNGIWRSDGTTEGTFHIFSHNRKVVASVSDNNRYVMLLEASQVYPYHSEIWSISQDAGQATHLKTVDWYGGKGVFTLEGRMYIIGREPNSAHLKIWQTDGTVEGTSVAVEAEAVYGINSYQNHWSVADKWAILMVSNADNVPAAFSFDGLTLFPVDHWPGPSSFSFGEGAGIMRPARALGEHFYTPMFHGYSGVELWQISSDGTTRMAGDLNPGVRWSYPKPLCLHDGKVYFLAGSAGQGSALYRTANWMPPAEAPTSPDVHWVQGIAPASRLSPNYLHKVYSGDMAVTPDGKNIYISGECTYNVGIAFPGQDVVMPGPVGFHSNSHFVARLEAATGRVQWVKRIASAAEKNISHDVLLAAAPESGVYAANFFDNEIATEQDTVRPLRRMGYLARFDAEGQMLWHLIADLGRQGHWISIVSDRNGNLYAAGVSYFYQGRIGNTTFSAGTSPALVMARISATGQVLDLITHDMPPGWNNLGAPLAMKQGLDGRLYIWLNRVGPNYIQSCEFNAIPMELRCYSEDLRHLEWKRNMLTTDLAYANAMSVAATGEILVTGRYRGVFELDGLRISTPCTHSTGFIAAFHPDGRLLYLSDFAPANMEIMDFRPEADGSFLIAGVEHLTYPSGTPAFFYPGYDDFNFPKARTISLVQRRRLGSNEVLGERRFFKHKGNDDQFYQHSRIAALPDGSIVLLDRPLHIGAIDTLYAMPPLNESDMGAVILRFDLPAIEPEKEEPIEKSPSWILGPNPASDQVLLYPSEYVEAEDLKISMFTAAGQAVPVRWSGGTFFQTVELGHLPAGLYFLHIQTNGKPNTLKVVKQ